MELPANFWPTAWVPDRSGPDSPDEILCDYGTEFQGPFKEYCIANKIRRRHSTPYSAFMQGLAERHNREVKNLARSLLIDSGLPPTFWAHALKTASYIKNRVRLNQTWPNVRVAQKQQA